MAKNCLVGTAHIIKGRYFELSDPVVVQRKVTNQCMLQAEINFNEVDRSRGSSLLGQIKVHFSIIAMKLGIEIEQEILLKDKWSRNGSPSLDVLNLKFSSKEEAKQVLEMPHVIEKHRLSLYEVPTEEASLSGHMSHYDSLQNEPASFQPQSTKKLGQNGNFQQNGDENNLIQNEASCYQKQFTESKVSVTKKKKNRKEHENDPLDSQFMNCGENNEYDLINDGNLNQYSSYGIDQTQSPISSRFIQKATNEDNQNPIEYTTDKNVTQQKNINEKKKSKQAKKENEYQDMTYFSNKEYGKINEEVLERELPVQNLYQHEMLQKNHDRRQLVNSIRNVEQKSISGHQDETEIDPYNTSKRNAPTTNQYSRIPYETEAFEHRSGASQFPTPQSVHKKTRQAEDNTTKQKNKRQKDQSKIGSENSASLEQHLPHQQYQPNDPHHYFTDYSRFESESYSESYYQEQFSKKNQTEFNNNKVEDFIGVYPNNQHLYGESECDPSRNRAINSKLIDSKTIGEEKLKENYSIPSKTKKLNQNEMIYNDLIIQNNDKTKEYGILRNQRSKAQKEPKGAENESYDSGFNQIGSLNNRYEHTRVHQPFIDEQVYRNGPSIEELGMSNYDDDYKGFSLMDHRTRNTHAAGISNGSRLINEHNDTTHKSTNQYIQMRMYHGQRVSDEFRNIKYSIFKRDNPEESLGTSFSEYYKEDWGSLTPLGIFVSGRKKWKKNKTEEFEEFQKFHIEDHHVKICNEFAYNQQSHISKEYDLWNGLSISIAESKCLATISSGRLASLPSDVPLESKLEVIYQVEQESKENSKEVNRFRTKLASLLNQDQKKVRKGWLIRVGLEESPMPIEKLKEKDDGHRHNGEFSTKSSRGSNKRSDFMRDYIDMRPGDDFEQVDELENRKPLRSDPSGSRLLNEAPLSLASRYIRKRSEA